MPIRDTAPDWELLGSRDAYWAVLTDDRFRKENFNDAARQVFFESGQRYVEQLFRTIQEHIDADFAPQTALDFGCGVGRVLIPLAQRVDAAVGVDISTNMLTEARLNIQASGLCNASLVQGDDDLAAVAGPFDFIHSTLVFQHIPVERGLPLLHRLVEMLREGGVGALHLTYAKRIASRRSLLGKIRGSVGHMLRSIGLPARVAPPGTMHMYDYPLNTVMHMLQQAGARRLFLTYTDHGGCYGVTLHFQIIRAEP